MLALAVTEFALFLEPIETSVIGVDNPMAFSERKMNITLDISFAKLPVCRGARCERVFLLTSVHVRQCDALHLDYVDESGLTDMNSVSKVVERVSFGGALCGASPSYVFTEKRG